MHIKDESQIRATTTAIEASAKWNVMRERQYHFFYGMLIYLALYVFIWVVAFFFDISFPIFIATNGNRGDLVAIYSKALP